MTTTDANGIAFIEVTDAISPFQTLINGLQTATSAAVGGRQKKTNVTGGARPGSPTAGDLVFETDTFNSFAYDGTAWRPVGTGIYSAAYINGNITVNTGTATTLSGTGFVADARGITYTSGTGFFTVPVAGMYQINYGVQYDNNTAGAFREAWVENGAGTRISDVAVYASYAAGKLAGGTRLVRLTAGTTLKLVTFHSAGGPLNAIGGTSGNASFLDIVYIGG